MNFTDYYKANTAINSLAKEWGKTPEKTRQILVRSYANMLKEASPIKRMQYYAMMKTENPTAEEIVLQLAKEIVPEQFVPAPANPLKDISHAWATFQEIAEKEKTAPEEVRKSIAETIDIAYGSKDLAVRARWNQLFPNGKPTPEAFILQMTRVFQKRC